MKTSPLSPLPLPALLRWLQPREFPRKLGLCDRWFGAALARHGIGWVRTSPGPVWKLDLRNPTHRWLVYGAYEGPGFWAWTRRHAGRISAVVDSGANIGQTVLNFAARVPRARILAYEPGAAARGWLEEGVAANALDRVAVLPLALGAAAGAARLAAAGGEAYHGSWDKVNATTGEPITVATLDAELARLGVDRVDVWKLDLEGYELEALRGAEHALGARRIGAIYLEVAGDSGAACLAHLAARGYRPHGLSRAGQTVPWVARHHYDNALCLPAGEVRD